MNLPEESSSMSSRGQDHATAQAKALFPLESLQHLNQESAQRCQSVLGHGEKYGIWETPKVIVAHMTSSCRRIDLRQRIAAFLPDEVPWSPPMDALLDEGVLWLTRLGLLMRIGPAGTGRRAAFKPLDASSIAGILHTHLPRLVARGVTRRLEYAGKSSTGFAAALTADDLRESWANDYQRPELMRLLQLQGLHLWSDAPAARKFKDKTTAVRGARSQPQPEKKSIAFAAISDDYLAAMGPRVLWLIKDLGPNLIHLLDTLPKLRCGVA